MSMQTKAPPVDQTGGAKTHCNATDQYTSDYLRKKEIPLSALQAVTQARIEMRGVILFRQLVDVAGRERGFERIWPDGDKKVTKGATVRATFTPFGFFGTDVLRLRGVLIVCAGLADGYRIHEATELPVACCVGEPGLKALADCLFTCAPHAELLVAADNDAAGIAAAKATGRRWIVPGEVHHAA